MNGMIEKEDEEQMEREMEVYEIAIGCLVFRISKGDSVGVIQAESVDPSDLMHTISRLELH